MQEPDTSPLILSAQDIAQLKAAVNKPKQRRKSTASSTSESTPVTKKSQSKKKKTSSLSAYKFEVNAKRLDYANFKKEVGSYFGLFLVRTKCDSRVAKVYQELCADAYAKAIKHLKHYNSTYDRQDTTRSPVITFKFEKVENASNQEATAVLTLGDLGLQWTFDDGERTITQKTEANDYNLLGHSGEVINDDAARLEEELKQQEHLKLNRNTTKAWQTMRLTEEWLPIGRLHHLLDSRPEPLVYFEDETNGYKPEPIASTARITELQVQISADSGELVDVATLPINNELNAYFSHHYERGPLASVAKRTVFFVISATAAELLKRLQAESEAATTALIEKWQSKFVPELQLSICCTGTLNVVTGDIQVQASYITNKSAANLEELFKLQVVAYKCDAKVFTSKEPDATRSVGEQAFDQLEAATAQLVDTIQSLPPDIQSELDLKKLMDELDEK